jgi:IclR family transcriptional regulator, pca regulon regulatory protein
MNLRATENLQSAKTRRRKTPEPQAKPGDAYVQSFARGLAVIRAFSAGAPSQTLSEVAARTGLTRAGARRILLTLQGLGYVQQDGRAFFLTPRILDLGYAYLSTMPLWNLAEPVMEALVERVHESSSASVLDDTDIVYVLRVPTKKIMTINLAIGSRLPAYCTSMGRVLLGGLSDEALDATLARSDLRMRTARTVIDPEQIKAIVQADRKRGYSAINQELEEGLCSISVPITGRNGNIVAALNVSTQVTRTPPQQMAKRFLPELLDAASKINAALRLRM